MQTWMFLAVAKYRVELSAFPMNIWLIILDFYGIEFIDGLHNKSLRGDTWSILAQFILIYDRVCKIGRKKKKQIDTKACYFSVLQSGDQLSTMHVMRTEIIWNGMHNCKMTSCAVI